MADVCLILPDIRSTHNVGSIFRSAEIFGVKHIYICGYTPYPAQTNDPRIPHQKNKIDKQINKTALGCEKLVPFSVFPNPADAINQAKADGCAIFGLEQSAASIPLPQFNPTGKIALILGREVEGIATSLLQEVEKIIEIPQLGTKESLNLASACAILLYHLSTNNKNRGPGGRG